MLLTRSFAHRRATLLALAGALVVATFFALPQGQAFAAQLMTLFRGQSIKPISVDTAQIKNAYSTLYELDELGSLQGNLPTGLTGASSVSQAESISQLNLVEPADLPKGINRTPKVQALAPRQIILTLNKAKADAYFKKEGSSVTMPRKLDNAQIIMNLPGVAVLEYSGGGGKVLLGQAGQLEIKVADDNATIDEVRDYLLQVPDLKPDTVTTLKGMNDWQSTIPLAIPKDRAGWSSTSVDGSWGGQGVIVNDNSGLGSALLWQHTTGNNSVSLGLAGVGMKASELQAIARGLR
jgi:hypothetical protein